MQPQEAQVRFQLIQDEDEWPPFSVESIWCTDLGAGRYRVNNVPYFVRDVSFGDLILARELDDVPWFERVQEPSRNSSVHVLVCHKSGL